VSAVLEKDLDVEAPINAKMRHLVALSARNMAMLDLLGRSALRAH
jgi:hypothetical protein